MAALPRKVPFRDSGVYAAGPARRDAQRVDVHCVAEGGDQDRVCHTVPNSYLAVNDTALIYAIRVKSLATLHIQHSKMNVASVLIKEVWFSYNYVDTLH